MKKLMKLLPMFLWATLVVLAMSCNDDEEETPNVVPPKFETESEKNTATNIGLNQATVGAQVLSLGAESIVQHGHCWSTSPQPTTQSSKTELGKLTAAGQFSSTLTGLEENTRYYVRAYTRSSAGTITYGEEFSFTTIENKIIEFADVQFKRGLLAHDIDTDQDGEISVLEAQNYTDTMEVSSLGIKDLAGIEYFTNITHLSCISNNLSSLDVSANTALEQLNCSFNNLSSLDVSGCTALEQLGCSFNNLSSLDVSANNALVRLYCISNNLSSLDVSANTALEGLYCNYNNLSSLDVSGCTALEYLNCGGNTLTSLDVSANTALKWLGCNENNLSSLDVSANTALESLHCQENNIDCITIAEGQVIRIIDKDSTTGFCGENTTGSGSGTLTFDGRTITLDEAELEFSHEEVDATGNAIYNFDLWISSNEEGTPSTAGGLWFDVYSSEKSGLVAGTYNYDETTKKAGTYIEAELVAGFNLSDYDKDGDPTKGTAYFSDVNLGAMKVERNGDNYVISGKGTVEVSVVDLSNPDVVTATKTINFEFNYTGKPSNRTN